MPKTVVQIRQQIAELQQQEQALMAKEIEGVVGRIREAISFYQLSPEQLFGPLKAKRTSGRRGPKVAKDTSSKTARKRPATGGVKPVKARASSAGKKVAIKYKDENGNVWSGRGSQPRWLRSALETGKKLEDFAV